VKVLNLFSVVYLTKIPTTGRSKCYTTGTMSNSPCLRRRNPESYTWAKAENQSLQKQVENKKAPLGNSSRGSRHKRESSLALDGLNIYNHNE